MLVHRLEPQKLFRSPDVIGGMVTAEHLLGFGRRGAEVPAGWAALVTGPEGDYRIMPAGARIALESVAELFVFNTEPHLFSIRESRLFSHDEFDVEAAAGLNLAVLPDAAEIRSLRAALNGQGAIITKASLERFLKPHLRSVLREFVSRRPAADLVSGVAPGEVSRIMMEALTPIAFSAGLSILGPVTCSFASPTFQAVQDHESRIRLSERQARLRAELEAVRQQWREQHLERLGECFQRIRSQFDGIPSVELASLLRSFGETERGELYLGLAALGRSAVRTRWLAVAAGPEVLLYEPAGSDEPAKRFAISDDVGAPRSIRAVRDERGRDLLLVGTSFGLTVFDSERSARLGTYRAGAQRSLRGGFNRAAYSNGTVILSHSELGLVQFQLDLHDSGRSLLPRTCEGAATIRHANIRRGYLYFSRDDEVIRVPIDTLDDAKVERYPRCPATVTSMHVDGQGLFVGDASGNVLSFSDGPNSQADMIVQGIGRPVESVNVLGDFAIRRLYYADTTSAAHARILGDTFGCRYEAGGQTLRWLAAHPDLLAGVNDIRDRVFLWDPAEPHRPRRIIPVSRSCGHTIQDLCLIAE